MHPAPISTAALPTSSLVPCPDCGREVSARASSCPNCGRPFAASSLAKRSHPSALRVLAATAAVLAVGAYFGTPMLREKISLPWETECERLDRRCERAVQSGSNAGGAMVCGLGGLFMIGNRTEETCRRANDLLSEVSGGGTGGSSAANSDTESSSASWSAVQEQLPFGLSFKTALTLTAKNVRSDDYTFEVTGSAILFDGRETPGTWSSRPMTVEPGQEVRLVSEQLLDGSGNNPTSALTIERIRILRDARVVAEIVDIPKKASKQR